MDFQTHFILGLSLPYLRRKKIDDEGIAFFVGTIAPDLEIVLDPLADVTGITYFRHRAFPHSPLMAPLWTILVLLLFHKLFKAPEKMDSRMIKLALLGTYLSILLDAIAGVIPLHPFNLCVGLVIYTYEDTLMFAFNLVAFPFIVALILKNRRGRDLGKSLKSESLSRVLRRIAKLYIILLVLTIAFHLVIAASLYLSAPKDMPIYRIRHGAYWDFDWYVFQVNKTHVRVIKYSLFGVEIHTYKRLNGLTGPEAWELIEEAKRLSPDFCRLASGTTAVFYISPLNETCYNVTVLLVEMYYLVEPYYKCFWPFLFRRYYGYRATVIVKVHK